MVILIFTTGCKFLRSNRDTLPVVEHTFTIQSDKVMEAQAPLANTSLAVARAIDAAGSSPRTPETMFLVESLAAWTELTGPSDSTLLLTSEAVNQQRLIIKKVKDDAKTQVEKERAEHQRTLDLLKAKYDKDHKELEKLKADKALAEMWSKLWAILLVGGALTAVSGVWLRGFMPFAAIGTASMAGVVVVSALKGDIIWVAVAAISLAFLVTTGMWMWNKYALKQVVKGDQKLRDSDPVLKDAHTKAQSDAGIITKAAVEMVKRTL